MSSVPHWTPAEPARARVGGHLAFVAPIHQAAGAARAILLKARAVAWTQDHPWGPPRPGSRPGRPTLPAVQRLPEPRHTSLKPQGKVNKGRSRSRRLRITTHLRGLNQNTPLRLQSTPGWSNQRPPQRLGVARLANGISRLPDFSLEGARSIGGTSCPSRNNFLSVASFPFETVGEVGAHATSSRTVRRVKV